ncbi:Serine acetyltransferase [hydrothermal vent metagenome]|uniref:Serine acetyltransferase n=1 Tax=hydrothermal vent metagenome TaxID=652676 RepID=A0A3B0YAP9_9ZZZZ
MFGNNGVLNADIRRFKGRSARSKFQLWRTPGVKSVICYRFGCWQEKKSKLIKVFTLPLYLLLRNNVQTNWGIDIPKEAVIGPGLCVGHYGGIFISKHAVIGKNLDISQGVTIGMSGKGGNRGVPVIGDNVYIAPGAKLFGKINIGNNVKIGANAVIYKDIPDNAIVVCKPGFEIISLSSEREQEIEDRISG